MGVGLAVAVLLDATLVRAVLLPATMKLLGERNWYLPERLDWLPRVRTSAPAARARESVRRRQHPARPDAAPAAAAPRCRSTAAPCRIGVLTGGGDCPGLNAVIRAIVRKGINVHGHEFVGFRYGWAGVLNERGDASSRTRRTRGILHRGGTILGTSRTNPYKEDGGSTRVRAVAGGAAARRADPDRRRGHARRRRQARRGRHPRRRRPEDDRQRPRRHRLHVRLPDRGADRHRRDRPPAHDGGVAQPRDRRRGHGPPRRLDRRLLRPRRRRRRDPRPRAAVRHRRGLRRTCAAATPTGRTFSIVVVAEGATPKDGDVVDRARRRRTRSATCGSAASRSSSRRRSRSARATRRA